MDDLSPLDANPYDAFDGPDASPVVTAATPSVTQDRAGEPALNDPFGNVDIQPAPEPNLYDTFDDEAQPDQEEDGGWFNWFSSNVEGINQQESSEKFLKVAAEKDKTKPKGVFGGSFGILSPEEQKVWINETRTRAEESVKTWQEGLARTQKFIDEKGATLAPQTRQAVLRNIQSGQASLLEAQQELKDILDVEAGRKPAATLTGWRSSLEVGAQGLIDDVAAGIVKSAGLTSSYLSQGDLPQQQAVRLANATWGKILGDEKMASFNSSAPDDNAVYKVGELITEFAKEQFPGDEARQREFSQVLSRGAGNMIGFYGTAGLGALLKSGKTGMFLLTSALGAGVGGSHQFEDATKARERGEDVSELERLLSFMSGAALGATESIPIMRSFAGGRGGFMGAMMRGAETSAEEAFQEGFQQIGQNLTAQQLYDPNRKISEGVGEGVMAGGILGFLGGAGVQSIIRPREFDPFRDLPTPPEIIDDGQSVTTTRPIPETAPETPTEAAPEGKRGVDVIQFIRAKGGLKPSGELDAVDARRYPGLVNGKGLSADQMREAMVEAGYLEEAGPDQPAVTTPQDVFDLVGRAISGERIVPASDAQADQQFAQTQVIRQFDEEMQAAEQNFLLPEIEAIDAEAGFPVLTEAYAKLNESERAEVVERNARGEDIGNLIEEMAVRNDDRQTIAAMAIRKGLNDQQIGQLRELIQAQAPELAQGFEELLVQLPKQKKARQSSARQDTGVSSGFPRSMGTVPRSRQQRMQAERQTPSAQDSLARLVDDAAPAVPIRRSYTTNAMVSLVDGSQHSDLRPHLKELGLSEDQYRQIFGLPAEYPLSWKELVDSGINPRTMEVNPPSQEEVKQILEGVTPQRQALPSMEEAPIDQQVSDAYWSLTQRAQDWVSLRDLRAALPNIPRSDLDAALKRMYLGQAVNLSSQDDQGSLTPADREASMQMGASRIDMLSMENPLQASEEARQTTEELPFIEEVQNRRDLRRSFADILDSKTPRSQWAKKLGVTDEDLQPLIDEAIQRKWLRRDKNGNVRRTPKSQRVGNIAALAIGENLPDAMPGEGSVVKTDAAQGRNASLQAAVDASVLKILPDDVQVDVVDNIAIARLRREDELLALREQNDAFYRWFGDSKVVDENGEPLVVYHGSPIADLSNEQFAFEDGEGARRQARSGEEPSNAIYFTDDQNSAVDYANGNRDGIASAYLKIEQPLDLRSSEAQAKLLEALDPENRYGIGGGDRDWSRIDDWFDGEGNKIVPFRSIDDFGTFWDWAAEVSQGDQNAFINDIVIWAKNNGYDALIFQDGNRGDISTSYAVFDPTQIKSAIGNRGTFDPTDPRISYALRTGRGQTESDLSDTVETSEEGVSDEQSSQARTGIGVESGTDAAVESEAGTASDPGEGGAAGGRRDDGAGLRDRTDQRIIRQESASLDADGNIIAGRPREGKASEGRGSSQPAQRIGTSEPFRIAGLEGRVTAEPLSDNDVDRGNLARLTYQVYQTGTQPLSAKEIQALNKEKASLRAKLKKARFGSPEEIDAINKMAELDERIDRGSPSGEMQLVQRFDGAWEIDFVTSKSPHKGTGTKLYNAVEKDLGIRMSPSGVLSDAGLAFWQKRSPASVQWHVATPTWKGFHFSPRKVYDELDRVGKEIQRQGLGSGSARFIPVEEREQNVAALKQERKQLIKLMNELPLEARAAKDSMFALRAFHGSPHDFDRFDISRIGTGEGAQAFGHGLYFAENELVARSYQNVLAAEGITLNGEAIAGDPDLMNLALTKLSGQDLDGRTLDDFEQIARSNLERVQSQPEPTEAEASRYFTTVEAMRARQAANLEAAQDYLAKVQRVKAGEVKSPGQLYEVEIDVEPEQLLDWDKPLSEQSEKIQEFYLNMIRSRLGTRQVSDDLVDVTLDGAALGVFPTEQVADVLENPIEFIPFRGKELYDDIARRTVNGDWGPPGSLARQFASDALRDAGIPGIRYLDQGSRDAGEGSRNIVLFDDSLVTITKKNGKPVTAEERQQVVDQMFSLRGFYSPAIRAAEQLKQERGTGQQFWSMISKAPGVRRDELDWMGLEEFLTDKPSITRDEVLAFMRAHQVELDERVLTGVQSEADVTDPIAIGFEDLPNSQGFNSDELEAISTFTVDGNSHYIVTSAEDGRIALLDAQGKTIAGAGSVAQAIHIAIGRARTGTQAKFEDYKVPGGTNYRELLIRLPELGSRDLTPEEQARLDALNAESRQLFEAPINETAEQKTARHARIGEISKEARQISSLTDPRYTSPHFQDQEIVHLRVDDRTGPNGEKVLFINEVQSDLHQKGRKKGYDEPGNKERLDVLKEEQGDLFAKRAKASLELGRTERGTPRYGDLIRQINEIEQQQSKNSAERARLQNLPPDAPFKGDLWLELALKRALLYASENGYDAVSWARSDQIAKAVGADPESLTLQYDQKIGKFLDKYTKKWGGKVDEAVLPDTQEDFVDTAARLLKEAGGDKNKAYQELERYRSEFNEETFNFLKKRIFDGGAVNPIIRITPQMRASVMQGQPLAMRQQPRAQQPEALGQTDVYNMLISISARAVEAEAAVKGVSPEQEAVRVLRHEAVEFFKALGIFTPKEWQLLQRTAKQKGWVETTGVRQAYTDLYQNGMGATELNNLLIKEAIAEQYSEFHLGRKQFTPSVTRVFQRIKDFLDRIANALRGMGFQTWDDIFTKIDQGEFKQRYEQAFGVQRPSQQGGAQPIVRAGQLPDARGRQPAAQPSPVLQGISKTIRDFKRTLGMTVRQGRLDPGLKRAMKAAGAGDVVGQFSRDTGVTRLQVSNDFDTLTHEGGHHLEVKYGRGLDAIKQQFAAELNPLASPGKDQLSEGFAEFFRRYVTDPQTARLRSPGFYDAFEDFIDAQDPEFFIKLQNVQKAYDSYIQGDPTDAKMANQTVLVGRKGAFSQFMEDAEENGLRDTMADRLHVLYYDMIGKNHGFWLGTKILLDLIEQNTGKRVDLKAVDNPNKLLRRINHTAAWARQDLKNGITLQSAPNGGGVSMHDVLNTAFGSTKKGDWNEANLKSFGDYLISRRAVHLYVRHRPQLRQVVQQFVAQNPSVSYLLPRLPVNNESTLEYAPTLEPLSDHLQSLVDYEAANPQFQKAADLYYQFSKDILRFLAEKGLISSEDFTRLSVDTDYAPFQRDMSDRVLATGSQAMVKRGGEAAKVNKYDVYRTIKGSTRDIINPIQSTVQFVYEMRLRAALNDTMKAMDRLASAAGPGGGAIFERLPPNEAQAYTVQIQQALKNAAKDAGMSDADTIAMLGNVEQYLGNNAATMLFTQGQAKERGERIIWFYEDGKPVPARLGDDTLGRMMFEAFTTMGKRSADLWMKILAIPAQTVRFGVTNAFDFIFRNIFVDSFAAPVNSPYAMPLVTQISGLRQILGGGRYHQLYNRAAGMMGGEMTQSISDQGIDRDIKTLRDKGFKVRMPRNVAEVFKMVFQIGEFSETATRVGIFKNAFESAIADGMTEAEAAAEAAFAAHDVIDFSRHGSKTEVLRRSITFMNAAGQGMDKYIRSMTGQGDRGSTWKRASKADFAAAFIPYLKYRAGSKLTTAEKRDLNQSAKAWAFTVLVMGGMSFIFTMLGEDDEMVEEVPDRLKATHWVVSINGVIHLLPKDVRSFLSLPEETDAIVRLPKPFEMAWVANGIERGLAAARKDDPTAFNDYLKDLMEITSPPNGIPALDIPYEWISGKSFYTGRDIIPIFEQELERADQFGPYTSEASKVIGDAVNISPYYVDHFTRAIGASIARDVHTVTDMLVGKGPTPRTEEFPVARRFSYNVARNSQSMEKFYDLYYSSEGMKSWFWDTVSSDARSFQAAKNSYKSLVDDDKLAAADDLYQRLNPDQKVFAVLGTHFKDSKSRYRNLHPVENASDGITVANKLMKEIVVGGILAGKREEKVTIDRAQAAFARNELGHIRRGFAQNALHIMKVPGWANQRMMDVDKRMATLQAGAPEIYDEFVRRLKKEKFLDFKHVSQVWPDVKERILAERDKASLGDLVAGGAIQPAMPQ